ncbi:hypothetical protein V1503_19370 [Bacillus sp. SCS-151]|uniref:hypothetical protein n=1 Tax=Nanhaiella sioensis TaxID=3115293 RepID=UPI00397D1CD1
MKEILAIKIDLAISKLGINAEKTYEGEDYQVWEMDETEYQRLCDVAEADWKDEYGMWRSSTGSTMGNDVTEYNINSQVMLAWDGEGRIQALKEVGGNTNSDDYCYGDREYFSLLEYLCEEVGCSAPRNVVALAVDLAKYNNMKMSELFKKYQG